jgi:urease accessory protein
VTAPARGEALLRLAWRHGRTVLEDCFCRAPYHLSGPLCVGDATRADVLLQTSGGGMLSGDALRLAVYCGDGARARIGGVGATRLLPAEAESRQDIRLHLEPGSTLIYMPEPLIPCAGAAYSQTMEIDAGDGATAVIGEMVTAGRVAHDERFAYRRLSFAALIRRQGRVIMRDRLLLEPGAGHLPVQLGAYTHLAGLTLIGTRSTAAMAAVLHEHLDASGVFSGVTLAAEGVLLVRMLGHGAHPMRALIDRIGDRYLNAET